MSAGEGFGYCVGKMTQNTLPMETCAMPQGGRHLSGVHIVQRGWAEVHLRRSRHEEDGYPHGCESQHLPQGLGLMKSSLQPEELKRGRNLDLFFTSLSFCIVRSWLLA